MKKAFLDNLVGMNVKDASRRCTAIGYDVQELEHGMATIMIVVSNQVKLWLAADNATVRAATLGDTSELED